jgi:hypothetical protein
MLGSLVRASVNLTQPQLNLSLDVMNRLTSNNGGAWEGHLKNFLRSGLPSQFPVLELVSDHVVYKSVEDFDPHKYFKTSSRFWVSDDFKHRVLAGAHKISVPEIAGSSYNLITNVYDREVKADLPPEHVFKDESEFCAYLAQKLDAQPGGKKGDLLTNGYANIFYVSGVNVSVRWIAGDREWNVYAWGLDDGCWNAGRRVFSRN